MTNYKDCKLALYTYLNRNPYNQQAIRITAGGFDIRVFCVIEDHVVLKISACLCTEQRIRNSGLNEIE